MKTDNLLVFYQIASQEQYEAGVGWYPDHHYQLTALAEAAGLPFVNVAAAAAILSPGIAWADEMRYLAGFIAGGETMPGFYANKVKARRALAGDLTAVRGPKVEAFFDNLVNPFDSERVTIDRWAWRGWAGDPSLPLPPGGMYIARHYGQIEADYIAAAEKAKLQPLAFQAVVWNVVRELGGYA